MPKKDPLGLPSARTFVGPALLWKRALSFIVDLLIINLTIFFPFRSLLQRLLPAFSTFQETYAYLLAHPGIQESIISLSLMMAFFGLLYFAFMEYRLHTTPGKMLFRIYITSEHKQLRFWHCLLRSSFMLPIFPFVILWVVDPLFLFFSIKGQRLLEVLSKTRTVERYMLG